MRPLIEFVVGMQYYFPNTIVAYNCMLAFSPDSFLHDKKQEKTKTQSRDMKVTSVKGQITEKQKGGVSIMLHGGNSTNMGSFPLDLLVPWLGPERSVP